MILFRKIRWKNFLSTGNDFTEIDFTLHKTTLISGTNGAGKSTMLDAIIFALYGKPFRKINKPQLVNTINNKDMMVELEFKIGRNEFLIRRGMKPNVFEIYKNGKLLNQDAAVKDYQEHLEKNILKINLKSFTQIVILGSATYVPFMELTTGGRREVIEDLLDIQVFSTMNNIHRDRMNANKSAIVELKHQIELTVERITAAKEHNAEVRKIKETQVSQITAKADEIIQNIEANQVLIADLEVRAAALAPSKKRVNELNTKRMKLREIEIDITSRQKQINKELKFYQTNDSCPTCKQNIDHDFKSCTIHEKEALIVEITNGLMQMKEKFEELEVAMDEALETANQISTINGQINEHRINVNLGKTTLKSLKQDLENAKREVEEIDTSKIISLDKEKTRLASQLEKAIEERDVNAVVASMLKDGGIKTMVIRQYVPIMNQFINKYLAAFDLFVNFELDENFSEVIKSRHRDTFTYASFSEGEKLRISLSILLTWRAVSKLRNSISTNLLIMDEVLDGAIDSDGADALINVLDQLNSHDNIFVISHRADIHEKFEGHIKFGKTKDFSHRID